MRYLATVMIGMACINHVHAEILPGKLTDDQVLQKSKIVLAQVDGKIKVPGLKQRVEILRDHWGVAHIYAKNTDDLFFAQGFVAAQDRLFQLDLWRRVAVGETAEIFGEKALAGDRFARLLKYRGDMDAEWKSYSPDAKKICTAFTNGINAYIDHVGNKLPIEFQILKFKPKRWRPEDVLGRMSGIIMCRNFRREIFRAQLLAKLGEEKLRQIWPLDPDTKYAPAPGLDLQGITPEVLSDYYAATKVLRFTPSTTQSNNWVVSGARSASGMPMLASDPHRSIALPSLRYLVHLNAPGWNVIGSGEPALPGVAIGHNERIAWGFTIVCTDQTDFFVEQLDPKNHDRYKSGAGFKPMKIIREKIRINGKNKPVTVKLRFTGNGPVIYEDKKRHRAFVLKWIGSEPGTGAYLGSLALDRARNKKEFLEAMKAWKLPNENIVYADKDGNIGWVAAALTPVRQGYQGLLPVPGNGYYGWKRFLKISELPQEFNPKRGYIATSNHNILPPGYKHDISFGWAPGYRFARVKKRLEAKKKHTLEDFKSIQHDAVSLPGKRLVRLAKKADVFGGRLQKFVDLIRNWDGVLSQDSQAGPLYAAWLAELQRIYGETVLPKDLRRHQRYIISVKTILDHLENPQGAFGGKAVRDAALRISLERAVKVVQKRLGDDPSQWRWGKLHTVTFRHPLSTLGPAYEKAFNLGPVGRSGDALTPNNTRHNSNFEQIHGATYRHVLDLADWDKGYATSTPGQSGQPGSPHYGDLFPLWAKGEYFPLAFSRKKVEEVTRRRLWLMP